MRDLFGKRVYVDANDIIYFGEGHPVFGEPARTIFEQAALDRLSLVTSELTVAEVLVVPYRARNNELVAAYLEALSSRKYLEVLPINRAILIASAKLRAESSNKLPDAIHLATAASAQCDVFLSEDGRIRAPDGLRIVRLSDVDPSPAAQAT